VLEQQRLDLVAEHARSVVATAADERVGHRVDRCGGWRRPRSGRPSARRRPRSQASWDRSSDPSSLPWGLTGVEDDEPDRSLRRTCSTPVRSRRFAAR
jgi:hypothetical protein